MLASLANKVGGAKSLGGAKPLIDRPGSGSEGLHNKQIFSLQALLHENCIIAKPFNERKSILSMAIIVTTAIMLMRNDLARISVDQQATGVSCPGELSTVTEANQRWRHTQHTTYRSHLGAIQALPLETHINRLPKRAKRKPGDPTEPKNHPLGNI